uniref:Uncharacterized protein n=1 Tax=Lepeophtheirus salmonis TaxID=72036 RepID=A0A0K2UW58_LEPSM
MRNKCTDWILIRCTIYNQKMKCRIFSTFV